MHLAKYQQVLDNAVKMPRYIFEGWVLYGEIFQKRGVKLRGDMDSQLVSGTHKKWLNFAKNVISQGHSFECLREYQPVLVMPKKFAEIRRNGKNLRKHNKSMKCTKSAAICRKNPILFLPFDLSKMVL